MKNQRRKIKLSLMDKIKNHLARFDDLEQVAFDHQFSNSIFTYCYLKLDTEYHLIKRGKKPDLPLINKLISMGESRAKKLGISHQARNMKKLYLALGKIKLNEMGVSHLF
tara:strand:+ start:26832 stop:27161 length:330 start_codon:yes stop_codon:yes gene_type:complete